MGTGSPIEEVRMVKSGRNGLGPAFKVYRIDKPGGHPPVKRRVCPSSKDKWWDESTWGKSRYTDSYIKRDTETRTNGKKNFLIDAEIEELWYIKKSNPNKKAGGRDMYLYKKIDLERQAWRKFGGPEGFKAERLRREERGKKAEKPVKTVSRKTASKSVNATVYDSDEVGEDSKVDAGPSQPLTPKATPRKKKSSLTKIASNAKQATLGSTIQSALMKTPPVQHQRDYLDPFNAELDEMTLLATPTRDASSGKSLLRYLSFDSIPEPSDTDLDDFILPPSMQTMGSLSAFKRQDIKPMTDMLPSTSKTMSASTPRTPTRARNSTSMVGGLHGARDLYDIDHDSDGNEQLPTPQASTRKRNFDTSHGSVAPKSDIVEFSDGETLEIQGPFPTPSKPRRSTPDSRPYSSIASKRLKTSRDSDVKSLEVQSPFRTPSKAGPSASSSRLRAAFDAQDFDAYQNKGARGEVVIEISD